MHKKGFTLIELLVVVAIVGVLISILLSVIARARSQSYQTVCASNLGQIGKALLMYAQDHDNGIPPQSNQLGGTTSIEGTPIPGRPIDPSYRPDYLWETLGPYLKAKKLLFCPADPYAHQTSLESRKGRIHHGFTSYAMNESPDIKIWSMDQVIITNYPELNDVGHLLPFAGDGELFNSYVGDTGPLGYKDFWASRAESDHNGSFNYVSYDASLRKVTLSEKEEGWPRELLNEYARIDRERNTR